LLGGLFAFVISRVSELEGLCRRDIDVAGLSSIREVSDGLPRLEAVGLFSLRGDGARVALRTPRRCGVRRGLPFPAAYPGGGGSAVVTEHRMAVSLSPVQTVLWDQIKYSGTPSDFAWVCPCAPAPASSCRPTRGSPHSTPAPRRSSSARRPRAAARRRSRTRAAAAGAVRPSRARPSPRRPMSRRRAPPLSRWCRRASSGLTNR
jgi:hypothetical protein